MLSSLSSHFEELLMAVVSYDDSPLMHLLGNAPSAHVMLPGHHMGACDAPGASHSLAVCCWRRKRSMTRPASSRMPPAAMLSNFRRLARAVLGVAASRWMARKMSS